MHLEVFEDCTAPYTATNLDAHDCGGMLGWVRSEAASHASLFVGRYYGLLRGWSCLAEECARSTYRLWNLR